MNGSAGNKKYFLPLFLATAFSSTTFAQSTEPPPQAFYDWARASLHPVTSNINAPSTADLAPLGEMIGSARIVAFGESLHSASEPLAFRNRVIQYLVEELGFTAVILESGLVESRTLNDYVAFGIGNFDDAIADGISHGFDQFRMNHELVRWLRAHNAALPEDAPKVQIFGMDVSGSPGNLGARRKPDSALAFALNYLDEVDLENAREFHNRMDSYLPALASTNDYGVLSSSRRDALSAAIEDLISLLERRQLDYVETSSEYDQAWAERAAVSARQVDSWFRQMPPNWVLADGLAWTSEAQIIRDRVMADNLDWVLSFLPENARVFVFAAAPHIAAQKYDMPSWMDIPEDRLYTSIPFGAYARSRHGNDYVNILNILYEGEIYFCQATNPTPLDIGNPEEFWGEHAFANLGIDEYVLDLRIAPPGASEWVDQVKDHRNFKVSTRGAFDTLYYVKTIQSDCMTN
ncbi:MAG: erythromycin esterase family protein [Pseudomonadales bacterium]|nr:erythromycin esterase family protein [Pseudomonadales bacterium]MCP5357373.1 erythromycin esterase family protein [Pseudomonadales bacterium]